MIEECAQEESRIVQSKRTNNSSHLISKKPLQLVIKLYGYKDILINFDSSIKKREVYFFVLITIIQYLKLQDNPDFKDKLSGFIKDIQRKITQDIANNRNKELNKEKILKLNNFPKLYEKYKRNYFQALKQCFNQNNNYFIQALIYLTIFRKYCGYEDQINFKKNQNNYINKKINHFNQNIAKIHKQDMKEKLNKIPHQISKKQYQIRFIQIVGQMTSTKIQKKLQRSKGKKQPKQAEQTRITVSKQTVDKENLSTCNQFYQRKELKLLQEDPSENLFQIQEQNSSDNQQVLKFEYTQNYIKNNQQSLFEEILRITEQNQ